MRLRRAEVPLIPNRGRLQTLRSQNRTIVYYLAGLSSLLTLDSGLLTKPDGNFSTHILVLEGSADVEDLAVTDDDHKDPGSGCFSPLSAVVRFRQIAFAIFRSRTPPAANPAGSFLPVRVEFHRAKSGAKVFARP